MCVCVRTPEKEHSNSIIHDPNGASDRACKAPRLVSFTLSREYFKAEKGVESVVESILHYESMHRMKRKMRQLKGKKNFHLAPAAKV